jgi:hypothetical protein
LQRTSLSKKRRTRNKNSRITTWPEEVSAACGPSFAPDISRILYTCLHCVGRYLADRTGP